MLLVLRLDHLTSNTPIARSSAGGITIMPSFRKAPAPTVWAFTAQRRKPQDGGEGAGDRKARPKVDTDQDSACDPLGHVSVLHCGAREQTGRQVIDQVADDSNDNSGAPNGPDDGALRLVVEERRDHPDEPGLVERFDQYKKPSDEWQYTPGDIFHHNPRSL